MKRPDKPPTKDEVKEWYNNATPGERQTFDHAAMDIAAWQTNAGAAWFGVSITPERIWEECESVAHKYDIDDAHIKFLYYNPMARAGHRS